MITAVVLTKNEEVNIARCLASLKFVDEIIVIDDESTDKTSGIAKGLGAKVYVKKLDKGFSHQRNIGLQRAKGEWVLFVDADEVVPEGLTLEILNLNLEATKYSGFYISRRDHLWEKRLRYGENGDTELMRLAKKVSGEWVRGVHEKWEVNGNKGKLKNHLDHFPHRNLSEFVKSVDMWSTLHAKQNRVEGKKSSVFKIIFYPLGKLLNNLIARKGALDGTIGVVAALMMSFHSFLAWSKLWLLQKNN